MSAGMIQWSTVCRTAVVALWRHADVGPGAGGRGCEPEPERSLRTWRRRVAAVGAAGTALWKIFAYGGSLFVERTFREAEGDAVLLAPRGRRHSVAMVSSSAAVFGCGGADHGDEDSSRAYGDDRADRPDATLAGDPLRGAGDIAELPAGVTRLNDPSLRATARGVPAAVASPFAHRGRVTWLDAREKVDRDRLVRVAVAAVTGGGQRFLGQPTIGGRVLWVSEEAAADHKAPLAELDADLDKVFFIRGVSPDNDHESSLPRLIALLRPVWVIIDPWRHYLQVHRGTAAAGPGAEKLLLGDLVDWARQYEVAVTVSHANEKNRRGASTDSAILGAADMVVSLGPGKTPTGLRLQASGRWRVNPVDICWNGGLGYSVVRDAEHAGRSRSDEQPIDERVVLHLHELGADVRPPARELAASLACGGRRYEELSDALERLLVDGIVYRAPRSGASSGRGRGYALTERGRRRANCLRQASDSGASTSSETSAARSAVASVSEATFPGVRRSGNATTPAREVSAEGCSDPVSAAAFPAVGGSGNAPTPAGEMSAARSAVASVSGGAGTSATRWLGMSGRSRRGDGVARDGQKISCCVCFGRMARVSPD